MPHRCGLGDLVYSVLECVAVRWSVLKCATVCWSVLQCFSDSVLSKDALIFHDQEKEMHRDSSESVLSWSLRNANV